MPCSGPKSARSSTPGSDRSTSIVLRRSRVTPVWLVIRPTRRPSSGPAPSEARTSTPGRTATGVSAGAAGGRFFAPADAPPGSRPAVTTRGSAGASTPRGAPQAATVASATRGRYRPVMLRITLSVLLMLGLAACSAPRETPAPVPVSSRTTVEPARTPWTPRAIRTEPGGAILLDDAQRVWVEATFARLPLERKVAQMIVPWVPSAYLPVDSDAFD